MAVFFLFAAIMTCKAPFYLLWAILIHEVGHLSAALILGYGLPKVSFLGAGIKLKYKGVFSNKDALIISLAGPVAGASAGLIFLKNSVFSAYCIALSAVNLMPISCLDGGAVLSTVCDIFLKPDLSYNICRTASVATVILMSLFNILIQMKVGINVTLLALSVYSLVTVLTEYS